MPINSAGLCPELALQMFRFHCPVLQGGDQITTTQPGFSPTILFGLKPGIHTYLTPQPKGRGNAKCGPKMKLVSPKKETINPKEGIAIPKMKPVMHKVKYIMQKMKSVMHKVETAMQNPFFNLH